MGSKNIILGLIIVIVIIILGYVLFFRGSGSRSNSGYYGNPPVNQQSNPTSGSQTPSSALQPNPPSNFQDQGTAAPTGDQIMLNANSNANQNSNGNTNTAAKVTDATIKNMAFSPAQITVAAGSTVNWTNQDSTAHTVTADNGQFSSGNLSSGDSFQFTFKTPGTYAYHCGIHPNMQGTIVVK